MASAAEQLAANFNFGSIGRAKELRSRIFFTLGALIVARIGTYIPMPGIDPAALAAQIAQQGSGLLDVFNTLAGGAVNRMAIFALGIMPYISASIIIQLMTTVFPELEALKKEGEAGRKVLNQYTRYFTVALAIVQAYGIAIGLEHFGGGTPIVMEPGWFFRIGAVITLTGGTMLLMWIGEQITSRGVGNGISLLILAGIVAVLPTTVVQIAALARTGAISPFSVILIIMLAVGFTFAIVFVELSQRRLPVRYPGRQASGRLFGGESSFLPLKVNTAGVIPPIFASSLLLLPATLMGFLGAAVPGGAPGWMTNLTAQLQQGRPLFMALYGTLIVFFTFFYTSVVFDPRDTADNLRKYGGFLPGIRPGRQTAEYLDQVLGRLTVIGAAYITIVCLVPEGLIGIYNVPFYLGGTSLLIMVSVTIDLLTQMQSHLVAHQYEGMLRKVRLRRTAQA